MKAWVPVDPVDIAFVLLILAVVAGEGKINSACRADIPTSKSSQS